MRPGGGLEAVTAVDADADDDDADEDDDVLWATATCRAGECATGCAGLGAAPPVLGGGENGSGLPDKAISASAVTQTGV